MRSHCQDKRNPTDYDIASRIETMGTDHKKFGDVAADIGLGNKAFDGMDLPGQFSRSEHQYTYLCKRRVCMYVRFEIEIEVEVRVEVEVE